MNELRVVRLLGPGVALCATIAAAAHAIQCLEEVIWNHPYIEALVAAILMGILLRAVWTPSPVWLPGIKFSAKTLLEIAVALLGASISGQILAALGGRLIFGIVLIVLLSLTIGYLVSRAVGLPTRLSLLVACGNAICGNSAIIAVAPVIGASGRDIGASISFTAILGIAVVLILPLLAAPLGLSMTDYGILAGLTVYAVPQVLAASVPISFQSAQVATLVKLVRVMMLGPVILILSLLRDRLPQLPPEAVEARTGAYKLGTLVPWFIVAFIGLAVLRSADAIPPAIISTATAAANILTLLAMAALGLGVELKSLASSAGRVILAACASILALGVVSMAFIHLLAAWH